MAELDPSTGRRVRVADAIYGYNGLATRAGEVLRTGPDAASPQRGVVMHHQLWSTRLGGTCHSSPVAADGHLIVGCDDGQVYAFREKTK